MRTSTLWRTASVLTFLFAAAHTYGMFHQAANPDEQALLDHMRQYQFQVMGSLRTYWHFYFGFGMFLTAGLTAVGAMSWVLASAESVKRELRTLAWLVFGAQAAFAALAWGYLFAAPAIIASLAALASGAALIIRRDPA